MATKTKTPERSEYWATRYCGDNHAFYVIELASQKDHTDADGATLYYQTREIANVQRKLLNDRR